MTVVIQKKYALFVLHNANLLTDRNEAIANQIFTSLVQLLEELAE